MNRKGFEENNLGIIRGMILVLEILKKKKKKLCKVNQQSNLKSCHIRRLSFGTLPMTWHWAGLRKFVQNVDVIPKLNEMRFGQFMDTNVTRQTYRVTIRDQRNLLLKVVVLTV